MEDFKGGGAAKTLHPDVATSAKLSNFVIQTNLQFESEGNVPEQTPDEDTETGQLAVQGQDAMTSKQNTVYIFACKALLMFMNQANKMCGGMSHNLYDTNKSFANCTLRWPLNLEPLSMTNNFWEQKSLFICKNKIIYALRNEI